MTVVTPLISNFTAGEISPLLEGQVFLDKYQNSARLLDNLICTPWGPATRRPGSRFITEIKSSANEARLTPFRFSTTQAYQIERGPGYFRFFKDKGTIVALDTDAAITNGTFVFDITGWTDISTGLGAIAHDTPGQRLALTPGGAGGADIASAEQAVTVGASFQAGEHVLQFRLDGAAGDAIELRIGTTTGGSEILADRVMEVGTHSFAFTPGASPVFIQFRNVGATQNKTLHIDNVALIDNAPIELETPYLAGDLAGIKWTQSADTLYLTHPRIAPRKLLRFDHPSWSLVEINFIDGPYLEENITATTLVASAATGFAVTITASGVEGINNGAGFKLSDVGRLVGIKNGADFAYARIVGFTSALIVTADSKGSVNLPVVATASWRLGLWSVTTGYPNAVTFHKSRLGFGGAKIARPQRLDLSKTADFETFTPGVNDADPISINLDADEVNAVCWMVSKGALLVGAADAEWSVKKASTNSPLAPSNVDADVETNEGCKDVMPIRASKAVLFVQEHGKQLIEMAFRFDADGFVTNDMTVLAEHITGGGIVELAYQRQPWRVVWATRTDGRLIGFTYMRPQEVTAWHPHTIAGNFAGGRAVVESVSVIPGIGADELWMIVKRTINGATKRYIEVLEEALEIPNRNDFASEALFEAATLLAQKDAFYLDSMLTYSDVPTLIITELDHLEGESVSILRDGAAHPDKIVGGGQITLDKLGSTVQVGLKAPWKLKPHRIEAGSQQGTAQGKKKRIDHVTLRLHGSLGVKVGRDEDNLEFPPMGYGKKMDTATALFTGDIEVPFRGVWERDGTILITGDQPFPATIVSLVPHIAVEER